MARIIDLEGFEVSEAADCKSGLRKLETHNIDVVLCDVKLPDGSGVDLTKTIKEKHPLVEVILLTAYGNIPDGVQAIKNGAYDYITKGDDNNKIIPLLYKAIEKVNLSKRLNHLEEKLNKTLTFDQIIGKSKSIKEAIELGKKVAKTDATVLLLGETGTGKEVFAQSLHQESSRSKNSFVAINCSAFSKELLESELFGHKAGAYTGAIKDQKGLFEEAHKGTIFLDEIGEMPLDLQAKILRVLESGEYLRIGDTRPTRVDIRIIAATNRNIALSVSEGNFREDLFYRISTFQINLPSLRERPEDIALLSNHFLKIYAEKLNKKINSIGPAAISSLYHHRWNGNVRELKNVMERAVILADQTEISESDLPLDFQKYYTPEEGPGAEVIYELAKMEKQHIMKVLNHTKGNKTRAAELLNIALTTLYRKLEEYKIQ